MDTKIIKAHETYTIRGEEITVDADQLVDVATNEPVFDEKLDDQAVKLAFSEYRQRHGILMAEEIVKLRHQFDITQRGFAALLGWSPTTIATYETGALPSEAKNNLLQALQENPSLAKTLYEKNRMKLSPSDRERFEARFEADAQQREVQSARDMIGAGVTNLFVTTNYTEYAGFTTFSLKKFLNAALFFMNAVPQLTKTKLNKLLFYTDFKYFEANTVSITGAPYARLNYGPVPDQYSLLYGLMDAQKLVTIEETGNNQNSWEYFIPSKEADQSVFSEGELEVLGQVLARFKNDSAATISQTSHAEVAWLETPNAALISYQTAMALKAL